MREPRDLVVATYNVHRFVGCDGRFDPERTARVIAEIDPDVVALQELPEERDPSPLAGLASALGMVALRGPTLERHDGHYGNALLCRVEPLRVERIDLSVPSLEPRGAILADLELSGVRLRVVATQLGLGLRERRWQVDRLVRALGPRDGTATVVLGDMNEWVYGVGALLPLHRRLGRAPAASSYPAGRPVLPLDRIWMAPRARMAGLRAHRSAEARVASDHLPVVARLRPAHSVAAERSVGTAAAVAPVRPPPFAAGSLY